MQWDLFCRVIDNFGDIGVCWRIAAELGARGHGVRLFTDDARALAWMAPQGAAGVAVLPWPEAAPANGLGGPGDVIIEAFGCELPETYQTAIAQASAERGAQPLWLNLEYLSAEGYVERCHRLPSPLMSGPAQGLTRWFFYPGFTPATGGLPREADLSTRQQAFDRHAWRAARGVAPDALAVSLFCYEPPALARLLNALGAHGQAHVLATPGRATAALQQSLGHGHSGAQRTPDGQDALTISHLPYCSQPEFDELLWACDLNLVRGEDSLVRALWAGAPFLWQIYPQHDDAHHAKLEAFLNWLDAPATLRHWMRLYNGLETAPEPSPIDAATLAEWRACSQAAQARLLAQDDLLTQLQGFIDEHR